MSLEWQRTKAEKLLTHYVTKLEAGNCWPSADECGTMAQAYFAVDLLTGEEFREWTRRIHVAETANRARVAA